MQKIAHPKSQWSGHVDESKDQAINGMETYNQQATFGAFKDKVERRYTETWRSELDEFGE